MVTFVEENDKEHIIDKLKTDIDDMAAEFEVLKAKKANEPKPAAPARSKKSANIIASE